MIPLYIFDIDGTIADCSHRLHYINFNASIHGLEKDFKQDWIGFHRNTLGDEPIDDTIITMLMLRKQSDIWFFTGRMEECRTDTIAWIKEHCLIEDPHIVMRRQSDYRCDTIVKKEMLDYMSPEDRKRLIAVFDDRKRVVDMWRKNDIMCYQVADGDY